MNHVSLALKYRPMRFADLVGQEQVTGPLAQAVSLGRIAPAYLFSGPRGSGKTTTARLLARALNCTRRKGSEPCGECESCVSILSGSSLDVIEIDGASNRGIDDIRDIRERVRYAPSGGGKKIYIVDEVHMLTEQAFNAFLKTLEEPPPHVVFVFATTDPNDLLETVRSRCQRYEFHRITAAEALGRLKHIALTEKLEVEEGALNFLAHRADGSLRDALVLLDQAANAEPGLITEARVRAMLGHADSDFYFHLSAAIAKRDPAAALVLLDEGLSRGAREATVFAGLCEHFRNLMLAAISPSLDGLLEATTETLDRYRAEARTLPEEDLIQMLDLCLDGASRLERSAHPRFQLELLVVSLARLDSVKSLESLLKQLESGEGAARPASAGVAPRASAGAPQASSAPAPQAPAPRASAPSAAAASPSHPPRGSAAVAPGAVTPAPRAPGMRPAGSAPRGTAVALPQDLQPFPDECWTSLLAQASTTRKGLAAFLEQAEPLGHSSDVFWMAVGSDIVRIQLEDRESVKYIEAALSEMGAPASRIKCVTVRGLKAQRAAAAPAPEAPAGAEAPAAPEPPPADAAPAGPDIVQRVIQMFGGEVVG